MSAALIGFGLLLLIHRYVAGRERARRQAWEDMFYDDGFGWGDR